MAGLRNDNIGRSRTSDLREDTSQSGLVCAFRMKPFRWHLRVDGPVDRMEMTVLVAILWPAQLMLAADRTR